MGIIEANGAFLAFSCGLQMKMLGAKDHIDKLNILFLVLVLFSIILYASSFYLFVGAYQKKNCCEFLLVYTNVKQKSLQF